MLAFKSNHNVQVLIGGLEALLRIYYVTKYVTNMPELVDSVTAVALIAFKRRELRERQTQMLHEDTSIVGRRRVASMVFALTNRREIAEPLAALYLLRGSCVYMSVSCTVPPLLDIMRELIQHDTHSCNLIELREGEPNIKFRTVSFLDYIVAKQYEFVMTCFRRKQSESTPRSDLVLTRHPLCSTHCISHHHTEAVPVITGIRIPYLDPDTPIELVIKRAQCALMLFRPYRSLLDLVSDRVSEPAGSVAYFQWEPTRTHFVREIMANIDYYYHTAKIAQEDGEFGSNEIANEHNSDGLFGTRDIVDDTTGNMQRDSEAPLVTDEFCQIFADESDATMTDDGSRLPIFPTECVKDSATDEVEPSLSNRPRLEQSADVVELIQHALESEHEWLPPKEQPDSLPPIRPHPTVNDVATVFTLNRRQHVASSLIAAALLRRFQQQELANAYELADYRSSEIESRLRGNQLLMFLGGADGTGNSRVIDAVSAFCSD
ncbi:LOW QUALITY PROTEIN: hypothetical protein PHMEG_00013376 [Phytophthora megakarya]|uniref:Uncharacterized protein n=1 Tax=Phytophthora megakarya TaxID=4795 RepID=A0A225W7X6_9STRA|nr:LOW QUALITY PROTEIN: hypothetical protein PHMEG_00013376 [Phytophthora megakarya]